eukprot:scaffold81690_cov54-Attheya_sp.AAC.1
MVDWCVPTMARRNSTPSHVAYVQLVLVIANNFMARHIHCRLGTTTYIVGNERPECHGRTDCISPISSISTIRRLSDSHLVRLVRRASIPLKKNYSFITMA